MNALRILLASGPEETALRFKAMPPMWLLIMIVLPAIVLVVWWIYRREADTAGRVIIGSGTLPVGVLTSFMGAPLFLYLLWRGYQR